MGCELRILGLPKCLHDCMDSGSSATRGQSFIYGACSVAYRKISESIARITSTMYRKGLGLSIQSWAWRNEYGLERNLRAIKVKPLGLRVDA